MHSSDRYLRVFPRPLLRALRAFYLGISDIRDYFVASGNELSPPSSLHFVGGGDFEAIGRTFEDHFVRIGQLRPYESVLDIGCGTGRMAIPLLQYLNESGAYCGFDISRKAISWCQTHITAKNPRFRFLHADIHNGEYNPNGMLAASQFSFPCGDASIDFAFATSVFTHMRASEVKRYLLEIRRVLKPRCRSMLTFFVIDETNRRQIERDKASLNFGIKLDDCFTIDRQTPERAIAYSENQLIEFLREANLRLAAPIYYGSWSGRPSMLDAQDVVAVEKI